MSVRLLQATLVLLLIPAAAYAVATVAHPENHGPASLGLASLSITAQGNATQIGHLGQGQNVLRPEPSPPSLPVLFPIGDDVEMKPPAGNTSIASVSISANVVQKNSSAIIAYDVTGTSLSIGDRNYQIINGTGIFNQHSLVVVLHATVKSGDWNGTLILVGHADNGLSVPGSVSVTFDSPQSKLASQFFLSLQGTLTLS